MGGPRHHRAPGLRRDRVRTGGGQHRAATSDGVVGRTSRPSSCGWPRTATRSKSRAPASSPATGRIPRRPPPHSRRWLVPHRRHRPTSTDGDLVLSGRTKNIIVLPNGLNVFPEDMEAALSDHGISQSVVLETAPGRIEAVVLPPGTPAHHRARPRRPGGAGRRAVAAVRADIDRIVKQVNTELGIHQRSTRGGSGPSPTSRAPTRSRSVATRSASGPRPISRSRSATPPEGRRRRSLGRARGYLTTRELLAYGSTAKKASRALSGSLARAPEYHVDTMVLPTWVTLNWASRGKLVWPKPDPSSGQLRACCRSRSLRGEVIDDRRTPGPRRPHDLEHCPGVWVSDAGSDGRYGAMGGIIWKPRPRAGR